MDISDLLGLPYPESDDPQTIALYMKDLAFKLDDVLTEIDSATDDFNARPCAMWTNLADAVAANGSTSVDWNLAAPQAYSGEISQAGASNAFPRLPSARTGVWLLGASVPSLVPTGTVNAGTERWINIRCSGFGSQFQTISFMGPRQISPLTGSQANVPLELGRSVIEDLSYETNVGGSGTPLTIQGLAIVPQEAVVDPSTGSIGRLEVDIGNRNTGSGFTLTAGTLFCWAVWLGYGTEQIVSV